MIMTRAWDEADTNDSDTNPILVVDEDIDALNETTNADGNGTGKRIGIPRLASRSFLTSSGQRLHATPIGNEDGEYDDIDDFDNNSTKLVEINVSQEGDYIDTSLELNTTVKYIDTTTSDDSYTSTTIQYDSPFSLATSNPTTNVKVISVNVSSGTHKDVLDTNITLKAFMCNIGTYTLKTKDF
jgi:hypothetical protein